MCLLVSFDYFTSLFTRVHFLAFMRTLTQAFTGFQQRRNRQNVCGARTEGLLITRPWTRENKEQLTHLFNVVQCRTNAACLWLTP